MKNKILSLGFLGCLLLAGCSNVGNAVSGADPAQIKAQNDQQPPLQQIRNAMFAPVPPAQKEKEIKAIEDKYHVSRNDAMKDLPPVKFNTGQAPTEVPTGK